MPLGVFLDYAVACIGVSDQESNDNDEQGSLQVCEQENTDIVPEQEENFTKIREEVDVEDIHKMNVSSLCNKTMECNEIQASTGVNITPANIDGNSVEESPLFSLTLDNDRIEPILSLTLDSSRTNPSDNNDSFDEIIERVLYAVPKQIKKGDIVCKKKFVYSCDVETFVEDVIKSEWLAMKLLNSNGAIRSTFSKEKIQKKQFGDKWVKRISGRMKISWGMINLQNLCFNMDIVLTSKGNQVYDSCAQILMGHWKKNRTEFPEAREISAESKKLFQIISVVRKKISPGENGKTNVEMEVSAEILRGAGTWVPRRIILSQNERKLKQEEMCIKEFLKKRNN